MTNGQMERAEWHEVQEGRAFFLIIAEWNGKEFEFWARESWDASWGRTPSSPERIAKAFDLTTGLRSRQTGSPKGRGGIVG
jgi:hypothetical protein